MADTPIPPPPWQRAPDRPARRRREPISRDQIVTAAIALLDREGLDALSMRRLAEELGTGAATLYWHVGSKDGLLYLVLDEVIGEGKIPDPDPERWREQIKQVARDQRAATHRHPWVVRVSIGRIPMGPNALRYSERILAILRAAGLPPRLAVQGYLLLIATVNGFTIDETGVDDASARAETPPPIDPDTRQQVADMARDYIASLPAAQFPNMTALADEFALADPDERFEFLIDIFVDGLARHAALDRRGGIKADRQVRGRAEQQPVDVRVLGGRIEAQSRQAVEHRVQQDPRLQPGQVHAQALVRPVAERDVLLVLPEDVERVRIRVPRRVPVRRAQRHGHKAA